ncbi:hypothetical protein [Streptomyces beihaiensis]|uniref:DUF3558 domain-containing protein n=1 Tax=Streptomyces beihaiensis TaxID=2984495 RepID=A0ABT3TPV6_9ACTN|nr:hypothetical protein [Streptomyces beihaiensis]MCX3058800.1 hypothetical protein [Streptomyces beihaiensis]
MRSLPFPVALAARLLPVTVLACVGWAWSGQGPAAKPAADHDHTSRPQKSDAPSDTVAAKTYGEPPAPCSAVTAKTVRSLVPGAKTAGKELSATDASVRRACAWSALKGYDYRWLDVSFEVKDSDQRAEKTFTDQGDGNGASVQGIGDEARLRTDLTTKDKQKTREAVLTFRKGNALVTVTYNGSDFESRGAPSAATVSDGATKAARDALAALGSGSSPSASSSAGSSS